MMQGDYRADSLVQSGSVRPAVAAQPPSWLSLSRLALRLRARKRRAGVIAAMLHDIEAVGDGIMTVLARMVTTDASPTGPPYTQRARKWLKIVPVAVSLIAVAGGFWLYRSEIAHHVEMTIWPATRASRDLAQVKQTPQRERAEAPALALTMEQHALGMRAERTQAQQATQHTAAELPQALQQDRDNAEKLAWKPPRARRELESQAAAVSMSGDKTAPNQQLTGAQQALQQAEWLSSAYQELLTEERARNQELEQQLAARRDDQVLLAQERARSQELKQQLAARRNDEDLLAQERARSQELEQQLAASRNSAILLAQELGRGRELEPQLRLRRETIPGGGFPATGGVADADTPDPTPAPMTDNFVTTPQPVPPPPATSDKPATMAARLTTPKAPDNAEAARLLSRASQLLSQGNIGTARIVLDRAAETGSAAALFALAETYNPLILEAWGTIGTMGDTVKARELYAKAFAGGFQQAQDRMNALPE